ncbi:hypothetical protein [Halomonas sp.]|uniref:hypothetical protein n=1 Tax=Halomonas sp. TaxID=1486246 RepID=UPI0035626838
MPAEWQTYTLDYRYGDTVYHIDISQTLIASGTSTQRLSLDGVAQDKGELALVDDGRTHSVEVSLFTVAPVGSDMSDGRPSQKLLGHDRVSMAVIAVDEHNPKEPGE